MSGLAADGSSGDGLNELAVNIVEVCTSSIIASTALFDVEISHTIHHIENNALIMFYIYFH